MSRNQREGRMIGRTRGHVVRYRSQCRVVHSALARIRYKLRTAERRLPWIKPIPWHMQSAMHLLGARLIEKKP